MFAFEGSELKEGGPIGESATKNPMFSLASGCSAPREEHAVAVPVAAPEPETNSRDDDDKITQDEIFILLHGLCVVTFLVGMIILIVYTCAYHPTTATVLNTECVLHNDDDDVYNNRYVYNCNIRLQLHDSLHTQCILYRSDDTNCDSYVVGRYQMKQCMRQNSRYTQGSNITVWYLAEQHLCKSQHMANKMKTAFITLLTFSLFFFLLICWQSKERYAAATTTQTTQTSLATTATHQREGCREPQVPCPTQTRLTLYPWKLYPSQYTDELWEGTNML